MTAWKQSDHSDFNFYNAHDLTNIWQHSTGDSIKRSLKERLNSTKIFVLLVGEKTKYLYKFVRWEIEQAQKMDIPIIVINLNGKRGMDTDNCPLLLKNALVLHVSFNAKIIQKALEEWEALHKKYRQEQKNGSFHYNENVYKSFGL